MNYWLLQQQDYSQDVLLQKLCSVIDRLFSFYPVWSDLLSICPATFWHHTLSDIKQNWQAAKSFCAQTIISHNMKSLSILLKSSSTNSATTSRTEISYTTETLTDCTLSHFTRVITLTVFTWQWWGHFITEISTVLQQGRMWVTTLKFQDAVGVVTPAPERVFLEWWALFSD